jgi:hypothetical protein
VYVRALAQRLSMRGYSSAVAAPGIAAGAYVDESLSVYRFACDARPRLELAYGVSDEIAAEGFRAIVAQARPDIVHLHARTAAVSERLVDVAHAAGARVIFTYHTSTASCARGTMMLFGETPCDGIIDTKRCVACALTGLGIPKPMAGAVAVVPSRLQSWAAMIAGQSRAPSALRIPRLIASGRQRFLEFVGKVDHVVAVSQWVSEVLRRNAVPVEKVTLCRQGVDTTTRAPRSRGLREQAGPLKIAYFGRIDYTKGPDLLGRALSMMPGVAVKVDIFAIHQSAKPNQVYDSLKAHAQQDARLTLRTAIAPDGVTDIMADYDLIAVPSRCLETGPLVALEAFAAGVPVIGANLGGIAELVRDGVDGVLVAPDDAAAWAATIRRLVNNRHLIDAMRARVEPPRTMNAVADDMATLYAKVLARS